MRKRRIRIEGLSHKMSCKKARRKMSQKMSCKMRAGEEKEDKD